MVTKEKSRITQPFSVQDGELSLVETDKKVRFFPTFTHKKDYLNVNFFLGHFGTITVNVLDENGTKLFSNKNENVEKLHKRCGLNQLERGTYTVEVVAGGEVFFYSILK